jgi:hypothetical protein
MQADAAAARGGSACAGTCEGCKRQHNSRVAVGLMQAGRCIGVGKGMVRVRQGNVWIPALQQLFAGTKHLSTRSLLEVTAHKVHEEGTRLAQHNAETSMHLQEVHGREQHM